MHVLFSFIVMKCIEIQHEIASHAILGFRLASTRELHQRGMCHCFVYLRHQWRTPASTPNHYINWPSWSLGNFMMHCRFAAMRRSRLFGGDLLLFTSKWGVGNPGPTHVEFTRSRWSSSSPLMFLSRFVVALFFFVLVLVVKCLAFKGKGCLMFWGALLICMCVASSVFMEWWTSGYFLGP